jgi:predicted XRE-type DNA-binding protein
MVAKALPLETNDDSTYKAWRLLQHIEIDRNGCWLWTMNNHAEGYGEIWIDGKRYQVNRLAYKLFCSEIPKGLWVLHHCDVRNCIRPSHLYLGTVQDNHRDMTERRRRACGERNGNSKLTSEDVKKIRQLASHGYSQRTIAKKFNVSQPLIGKITRYELWKTVNTKIKQALEALEVGE